MLRIKTTDKYGRGIYATKRITKGTVVDTTPIILLTQEDTTSLNNTSLIYWWFGWPTGRSGPTAIALGLGSLFNHSFDANCHYEADEKNLTMKFVATETIEKGEQLFINYGYDPIKEKERRERQKEYAIKAKEDEKNIKPYEIQEIKDEMRSLKRNLERTVQLLTPPAKEPGFFKKLLSKKKHLKLSERHSLGMPLNDAGIGYKCNEDERPKADCDPARKPQ